MLLVLSIFLSVSFADLPNWISNATVQSQIGTIFDEVDHVDLVIASDELEVIDQVDHLSRRQGEAILQRKSIRIYGEAFPSNGEQVCTSGRPIVRAIVQPDDLSGDVIVPPNVIDRDYDDEFEFIRWNRSYESFAKIWDQNHHGGYVIFANLSTFETLMRCLLDPVATYLVVLGTAEKFQWEEVSSLTRSMWTQAGVYRVFFLAGEQIYAFDPFLVNGTGYGVLKVLNNGSEPTVPRSDFNGYPLKIDLFWSTYSVPVFDDSGEIVDFLGVDAEVCREFVKALNFSLEYVPRDNDDFGVQLPNGSFNGVTGRISRHESDIGFVGFFIKDYFCRDMEFTTGLYGDELCCVVVKARRVPEYLLPITIFPSDLWGVLFLTGIFFSVVWIIIRTAIRAIPTIGVKLNRWRRLADLFNLSNEVRDAALYRKLIQITVDTSIIWVSAPFRRFTRSGIERFMLFGIMLVSVIFVSMFQSSLASIYLNPVYYKDIDSLEQLDKSGLPIPVKYKGFMDDVFPANYSPMMTSLRSKMVLRKITIPMIAYVAEVGNVASVTRKSSLSLDNAIYVTTKQIFMIPECPRLYNLAYVVPRHSVLLERINTVLLWMLNGGLVNHWIQVMNYNMTIKDLEKIRKAQGSDFKVLTLVDMQFPFYLLAIGLVLSTLVFIVEQVYYRITKMYDKSLY